MTITEPIANGQVPPPPPPPPPESVVVKPSRSEQRRAKLEQRSADRRQRRADKRAQRVPLAQRLPTLAEAQPVHRSWWVLAAAVTAAGVIAVGTWRYTARPVIVNNLAAAGQTQTSGSPGSAALANPLATVPFRLTPGAARMIGSGERLVLVELSGGTESVRLSYDSLTSVATQIGALADKGPVDYCGLWLTVGANQQPALPVRVAETKAGDDAVRLFGDACIPTATSSTSVKAG